MDTEQTYLLLVEDDPDILNLLKTTLTFRGYRVSTAHNGYEGLEAIQKQRPAIVIADIMMPKMDGFGLVNRLRLDPATRDIPVVFITATFVTAEDQEFAQNIGATCFIQKPIDLEQFVSTIRDLLKQGAPVMPETLKDADFYEGYRRRLASKLDQKNTQIARYQLLLAGTHSDEEHLAIHASLSRTINERQEIELLLQQIHDHLDK